MAVRSKEKQAVFLANPGTGSTSVELFLLNNLGWTRVGSKHDGFDELLNMSDFPISDYFVFTTVRNPFDFFISEYLRFRGSWAESMKNDPNHWIHNDSSVKERIGIALSGDFKGFVEYYLKHTGAPGGRWRYQYWEKAHFVMRTETLGRDFNAVLQKLNIPGPVQLHRLNTTPESQKAESKELFTDDLIATVSERYASFIEAFGYSPTR